jgi:hypothetical protein
MATKHVNVFICEEYGYRTWLWFPGMTGSELQAWWKNLDSVRSFFLSPTGLPGHLREVVSRRDDKKLRKLRSEPHWRLELHTDEDSGLRSPDLKWHHHKGFRNVC